MLAGRADAGLASARGLAIAAAGWRRSPRVFHARCSCCAPSRCGNREPAGDRTLPQSDRRYGSGTSSVEDVLAAQHATAVAAGGLLAAAVVAASVGWPARCGGSSRRCVDGGVGDRGARRAGLRRRDAGPSIVPRSSSARHDRRVPIADIAQWRPVRSRRPRFRGAGRVAIFVSSSWTTGPTTIAGGRTRTRPSRIAISAGWRSTARRHGRTAHRRRDQIRGRVFGLASAADLGAPFIALVSLLVWAAATPLRRAVAG